MAFQVAIEDGDFTRARVDTEPYVAVINQAVDATAAGKLMTITLPTEEVAKTVGVLQRLASAMDIGLRWDTYKDLGNGTTKLRFKTAEKRKVSPEAAAKRKATMIANGTSPGRKKAGTTKKAS